MILPHARKTSAVITSTVFADLMDQREYTKVLKSGEKVLVDPETTVSHILLIFYAFVNIGAFFSIAVVYIEKYRGFWLAYLAPGIIYFLLPVLLAASEFCRLNIACPIQSFREGT
jgi:hypothetical protein